MKQGIFAALAVLSLAVCGVAQLSAQVQGAGTQAGRKRVYIDGKAIPANRVVVKDGATYVEIAALTEAIGARVQSEQGDVMVNTSQPKCECDKITVEGRRFSDQFRSEVAGVADEIESLRAVVLKKENVPLGPRFEEIDRKLTISMSHVQTDADTAIYYALSYSNNSLAISYYQQLRGVPAEETQKNQLDSMMCAMESKFALMKGVLLPGGSCSVLRRIEAQLPPKPEE